MPFMRLVVMTLVLIALTPAAALADGFIVPFFGVNFGGDSGKELSDAADAQRYNWGVSFAWMGAGVVGFEGDIGYSPDFFGKNDLGGSSVLTISGNLLVGVPLGGQSGFGVRPYGVAGVGVMRPDGDAFPSAEAFGEYKVSWNFGGGVLVFFAEHVGVRGDVRYFRTFEALEFVDIDIGDDTGDLDFTRGSLGFILRF